METEIYLIGYVARRLGVSPQWARKLAEENAEDMGAFRLSNFGHWRFRAERFEKWFSKQGPKSVEVDVRSKSVQGSG